MKEDLAGEKEGHKGIRVSGIESLYYGFLIKGGGRRENAKT